uniref:Uncharacterized protein n=1 Tax=viral metagenome TaxID=1070528 RepID=A0A6M3JY62_9ZZZZ
MEQEKPQVEEIGVVIPPAEETQSEVTPPAPQPGTEPTPGKKTYSEEEYSQAMAKLQSETAQAKEVANRLAMEKQIVLAQEQERREQEQDRKDVEQGLITEGEASRRQQLRTHTKTMEQRAAQLQQFLQEKGQELDFKIMLSVASDVAQKYGVPTSELMKEGVRESPDRMRVRALELQLNKLREEARKPENFDKGPTSVPSSPSSDEYKLKRRYPTMYTK